MPRGCPRWQRPAQPRARRGRKADRGVTTEREVRRGTRDREPGTCARRPCYRSAARTPKLLLAINLRARGAGSFGCLHREDDRGGDGERILVAVLARADAGGGTARLIGSEHGRRKRRNERLGRELHVELGERREPLTEDRVALAWQQH